jgi:hypothetical protein
MTAVDFREVFRQVERHPLVTALILSLLIHLSLYSTWQLGKHLGWWQKQPVWLTQLARKLTQASAREKKPQPPQERAIPMTFVEVDPDTAVSDAPKDTKYYSSRNSKASNPSPAENETPKVDGKQDQVVRLMDNEKPKAFPLQPSPPKPPQPEPPVEAKPKQDQPGDLAIVRPRDIKPPTEGADDNAKGQTPAPRDRPRTLSAARAQKALLTGEKMRQEGGISSIGSVSFDAKATPFGEYDAAFIAAVEQCWHLLIEQHQGTQRPGKVVVDFRLTYDGRITDMKVAENDAGEILGMLCQSAILNPAPYPRWPAQMRQTIASNSREIRFTFYYN